jgi:hypothetical protein
MSARTRRNRSATPGANSRRKPSREERRWEHQRVRHAARIRLRTADELDGVALPSPHHTAVPVAPVNRDHPVKPKRRFKVWKTKSWKRRKLVRAQRARAEVELIRSL